MALTTTQINPNNTFAGGGLEGAATNVLTAVFWNRLMNLLFAHLGVSGYIGGHAHNASTQSVLDSTSTVLAMGAEDADTDPNGAVHDNVTNNSRLTVRTAGYYHTSAWVQFASNATGFRSVSLRLNGATAIGQDVRPATNGSTSEISLYAGYPLSASDYLEVVVIQNSGGALNVTAAHLRMIKA